MYCFKIINITLQETILTNSLINFQKQKSKYFEINRLLKYLNEILKKNLYARRNSIKSSNNFIVELTLIILYIIQFRVKIYKLVYRVYRDNYSKKSAIKNIRIIVDKILRRDIINFDYRRFSTYIATNLFKNNILNIEINVDKYNEKFQINVE